ncbi:class D beta-lactamase [Rhizobium sp. WW_1]|jgi:beta-lactamase class D|uniref:class D beta-lactamase n=1 Tax=Rhizobium sp. WW_1 TaxID=1907375 RepID=UPI00068A2DD3|nr:class D beta-lactamase [Rhizobium sp. WW_1]RKD50804.1 beta-lactamase class D [Rhizobium sp. WW_1]
MRKASLLAVAVFVAAPAAANAETICTIVEDVESGKALVREGDCDRTLSPASTFKLALSLMGYDAHILTDEAKPVWPYVKGYSDWSTTWEHEATPRLWMEKSIVWYSQRLTEALGAQKFQAYVRKFDYGNRDVSGNPGKHDGLTHAWLGSSLKISPVEQLVFLRKLVRHELGVSAQAYEMTAKIADYGAQPSGWHVFGKTGAMPASKAGARPDRNRMYGWFVGWAVKGDRRVVFARLTGEERRIPGSAGGRTRDTVFTHLFSRPGSL